MATGKKTQKAASKPVSAFMPSELVNNSRFYILCFSVTLSLFAATYMRTIISSDTLYLIRIQQIFGFTAIFFWYLALLATPLKTIFGRDGFMKQYLYDRRALGVSAAYFAFLHMLTGLFGQLGGLGNLLLLPRLFQVAILLGFIALITLLLMAATSFDSVIRWMTFPRWKWLHRLGYIGAILVFFHVWMIGTHLAYDWVRQGLFIMLVIFAALEAWRISLVIEKKSGEQRGNMRYVLAVSLFVLFTSAIYIAPTKVDNYRDKHVDVGMGH